MKIDKLRREEFENTGDFIYDKMSALRSIEMNITEMCNRSCSFCPHSIKEYKDSHTPNMKFPIKLAEILNKNLKEINYTGQLSFTGFGEPLINKELPQLIKTVSSNTGTNFVEINTNGDALNRKNAKKFIDSGVTHITVSLYDGDTEKKFKNELKGLDVELTFKHWYDRPTNHKFWTNRNEQILNPKELKIESPCYFPFSRIFLDWDGNVLLCANNWTRDTVVGNLYESSIKEIWLGEKFTKYREMLIKGKRNLHPCQACDMPGTLTGKPSFEYFKNN